MAVAFGTQTTGLLPWKPRRSRSPGQQPTRGTTWTPTGSTGRMLRARRSVALLHQLSRERDADGAVVATFDDYAVVRDIVGQLIGEATERTVSDTVRETVTTVINLRMAGGEVTVSAIGNSLGLDKSAASRRVRDAIDRGYLRNLEENRGRPSQIVVGDPLPENETILPSSSELQRLHGCTPFDRGGSGRAGRFWPRHARARYLLGHGCNRATAT